MGKKINAAVISVPTNFTKEQRDALAQAAKAADVEVLQMISEPTAAVLAYDARPEAEMKDRIIVVADMGGTRTDIAIIASRGGMYSVLATTHDYETAGVQLDQLLVDHFAKEFMKKNKTDPRQNPRSLAKLKLESEATKKALSLGGNASCSVESLADGIDFASTINRTRYEMLAGKVFGSFTRIIEDTVRKADLDILDIDEVCHPSRSLQALQVLLRSEIRAYTFARSSSQEEHPILRVSRKISNDSSHQTPASSHPQPCLLQLTPQPYQPAAPPSKRRSFRNSTRRILSNRLIPW